MCTTQGLALSQKSKQEIVRLVLSSLKKQSLYKLPATSDPSLRPSLEQHLARRTRTAPKRTGKKRAIVRRRRRHSSSSRDQDQNHQSPQAIVEPEAYDRYCSSSDQNSGRSRSGSNDVDTAEGGETGRAR